MQDFIIETTNVTRREMDGLNIEQIMALFGELVKEVNAQAVNPTTGGGKADRTSTDTTKATESE